MGEWTYIVVDVSAGGEELELVHEQEEGGGGDPAVAVVVQQAEGLSEVALRRVKPVRQADRQVG